MIRRRQIHPDNVFVTNDGTQLPIVSRDAILTALVDGVTTMDLAGGTLSVVVQRFPTGVPGEMVTVGAVMEYKDRTDARPQAEPAVAAPPTFENAAVEVEVPFDDDFDPSQLTEEEMLQHFPPPPGLLEALAEVDGSLEGDGSQETTEAPQGAGNDPIGDGLDPQSLQVEDLSGIPVEMR